MSIINYRKEEASKFSLYDRFKKDLLKEKEMQSSY